MRINHNLSALNAWKNMTVNDGGQTKSLEKLSSGLRIGRAADDAAGLSISEKMRGQISGLNQASRNAQDGISLLQTAEGALQETHSILQRMRELAVQSASDTVTKEDRAEIQKEVNALTIEIRRISTDTEFNTQRLLDGSFTTKTIHIGSNADQNLQVGIVAMSDHALKVVSFVDFTVSRDIVAGEISVSGALATGEANVQGAVKARVTVAAGGASVTTQLVDAAGEDVGNAVVDDASPYEAYGLTFAIQAASHGKTYELDIVTGINVSGDTGANANAAITTINNAINNVSGERSKLGAIQNRLEHTIANLATSAENLTAAESRIRDVDIAVEMMNFTKYQILAQASTAMLAQANAKPQAVLQLLR
jgi:flagellin